MEVIIIRKQLTLIMILLLMVINCFSCTNIKIGDFNVVGSNGDMKEAVYSVSKYTKVIIDGGAEVIYSNRDSNDLKVYAHQDILENMKASVTGDTLRINWNKTIITNSNHTPKIYISRSNLEQLTINGAAKIKDADTIKGDSFTLNIAGACDLDLLLDVNNLEAKISGAGKIKLSGNAKTAEMTITGAGNIYGFDLKVNSADINIYGAGNAEIHCVERLNGLIAGAGNIKYKGDPSVNPTIMGAGSIKAVD